MHTCRSSQRHKGIIWVCERIHSYADIVSENTAAHTHTHTDHTADLWLMEDEPSGKAQNDFRSV